MKQIRYRTNLHIIVPLMWGPVFQLMQEAEWSSQMMVAPTTKSSCFKLQLGSVLGFLFHFYFFYFACITLYGVN